MTTNRMSRSAWGLGADRGDPNWMRRGACANTGDLFCSDHTDDEAKAIHLCRRHCPVLDQCKAHAAQDTPVGLVQAGARWHSPPKTGIQQTQPHDPGHGDWCAGRSIVTPIDVATYRPRRRAYGTTAIAPTSLQPDRNRCDHDRVLAATVRAMAGQPPAADLTHMERAAVARNLAQQGWTHDHIGRAVGRHARSVSRYIEQAGGQP